MDPRGSQKVSRPMPSPLDKNTTPGDAERASSVHASPDAHSPATSLAIEPEVPEPCMNFRNAAQKMFASLVEPRIYSWETADPMRPWSAEARCKVFKLVHPYLLTAWLVSTVIAEGKAPWRLGLGFGPSKRDAENEAARQAYEYLRATYPNDL